MAEATLAPIYSPHQSSCQPKAVSLKIKASLGLFVVPALVFIIRFLPAPYNDFSYAITFVYALTGRRQAVVSLMLLCLLNMATHAFGSPPELAQISRHFVLAAAAFSATILHGGGLWRTRCPSLLLSTTAVCGLIVLHSVLISEIPVLSFLKSTMFSLAIIGLFAGWGGMSNEERRRCEIQTWGIVGALAVLSALMLVTPLGYMTRGLMGFQGLLTHAQPFGCMMGVYAVFMWMLVITRKKLQPQVFVLASVATAYVYLSKARIGGLTLVAGLFAGLVIAPLIPRLNRFLDLPKLRFSRVAFLMTLVFVAVVASGGLLTVKLSQYAMKYDSLDNATVGDFANALYRARGSVVEQMIASISRKPLTGIGFGVPTEGGRSTPIVYDPIFNLPVMATVEKGVMPVAVLEELGLPLGIVVYVWLIYLFVLAGRGGAVSFATFSAAVAVNAAEAIFFSPGGAGLFFLTLTGMAVTATYYVPRAIVSTHHNHT